MLTNKLKFPLIGQKTNKDIYTPRRNERKMEGMKDLLIVGDSFCLYRENENHWPFIVAKQVALDEGIKVSNYKELIPRGTGLPGRAWWAVREHLLKEIKIHTPKILIICHTDLNRLANEKNLPLSPIEVIDYLNTRKQHIYKDVDLNWLQAAGNYYKYLFSPEYHHWAAMRWYLELDNILKTTPRIEKIIHIHCFNAGSDFIWQHGVTIRDSLWHYCEQDPKIEVSNHLSIQDNRLFARFICDLLSPFSYRDGHNVSMRYLRPYQQ